MAIGRATAYVRQKARDHFNNIAAFTPPSTLSLGFTTVAIPANASLYSTISATECVGNGYAQTTLSNSPSLWTAADATGASSNSSVVTCFTATANWTVAGIAFFIKDASGNLWYTGAIDAGTPIIPAQGQIVTFPAGSIILTDAAAS